MDKKQYISPTTPNLKVDLRSFIIELVCLNCDNRLGEYFWRSDPWKDKFRREIAGFKRWSSKHADFNQNLNLQKAMIYAIKVTKCKSMLSNFTRNKLSKICNNIYNQYDHALQDFNSSDNRHIVRIEPDNKISKIREIDNHV